MEFLFSKKLLDYQNVVKFSLFRFTSVNSSIPRFFFGNLIKSSRIFCPDFWIVRILLFSVDNYESSILLTRNVSYSHCLYIFICTSIYPQVRRILATRDVHLNDLFSGRSPWKIFSRIACKTIKQSYENLHVSVYVHMTCFIIHGNFPDWRRERWFGVVTVDLNIQLSLIRFISLYRLIN